MRNQGTLFLFVVWGVRGQMKRAMEALPSSFEGGSLVQKDHISIYNGPYSSVQSSPANLPCGGQLIYVFFHG